MEIKQTVAVTIKRIEISLLGKDHDTVVISTGGNKRIELKLPDDLMKQILECVKNYDFDK